MSDVIIGNTIKRLRSAANIKTAEAAEFLGKQSKTVNAWEHGRGEPNIEELIKLQSLFGTANILAEIAADKGLPYFSANVSPDEELLIKKYRMLDKYGKSAALHILETEYQRMIETGASAEPESVFLPLAEQKISVGQGIDIESIYVTREKIAVSENHNGADFALRIDGDGYEPQFSDGDTLLIKRQSEIAIGEIGIFAVGSKVFLRGFAHGRLISLAKGYNDIITTGRTDIRCLGKIIARL
ncbi:MAG: helix-turn-helix domain-containing protein [Ruminococcus sp.]|jgi:transcriptional regulator with XRE-family HTH domain|nr:helix-turn-helix domain-containing protein [Ruminococcus sp.]